MRLVEITLRNGKAIAFAVAVLAALGVRAYLQTPQAVYPAMKFSRIDVVAQAGDFPAERVRASVTRPLEQALQSLPSVAAVRSTSTQGSSEILIDFTQGSNPQTDLQYVNSAVEQIRSSLHDAQSIASVAIDTNSEPLMSFAFTSKTLSQATLGRLVQTAILPKLYGSPGLGRALVIGAPAIEYHVALDPAALVANGLGAADVAKTLNDATAVSAVGSAERYYQRFAVIVDANVHDGRALEALSVPTRNGASVPLGALGRVGLGVSPMTSEASFDARKAVILNAYSLPDADLVGTASEIRSRLAAARAALPRDVEVATFWDQTTFIVNSQVALRDAILIGALLAIVVIYLFLRDWRLTLVAAAVIPLAMAIAVFALSLAHQTLNLMSVGGLAVAVGLIIDDAIVVIEGIARTMHDDPSATPNDAIARTMSRLTLPMIASTATTVVVFVPLSLLTGVSGFFFRALAFTLATALIVSLALAIFLAPVVARALLARARPRAERRDGIAALLERYDPLLLWALEHRVAVGLASTVVLAATFVLMSRLPSEFLPKTDEGKFEIAYRLPTGITLSASGAAATAMERIVVRDPAVDAVGRLTGIDSNGYSPTAQNAGLLRATLKPPAERYSYEVVSSRLRERLQAAVPASTFDFRQILEDQIDDLQGGSASPLEIDVRGPDQTTLIVLADRVVKAISNVDGVVDANNGIVYDDPSVRVAPAGARLVPTGTTSSDLGNALGALSQGTIEASLPGALPIPVRVAIAATDPALTDGAPVFAGGRATALRDLAALQTVRLASNLSEENGALLVRVTANFEKVPLSSVSAGIGRALHGVSFPPGYSADLTGEARTQARSFGEFLNVIAIAVALVFAVMLAAFGSFRLPLVVLAAIPQALIGVALALTLTHTPFNVSSFMGLLLLVGIVVKNGILLIDVANERRRAGASVADALRAAGRTRLRPIVMTTLAAIGGLLPLAFGIGQGAEFEKPLAIAVVGGLSTATIFTLFVIPVLYAAFAGRDRAVRA